MKRYVFTCVMSYGEEVDNPQRYVNSALMYGDKHQDYALYSTGEIKVEDMDDED